MGLLMRLLLTLEILAELSQERRDKDMDSVDKHLQWRQKISNTQGQFHGYFSQVLSGIVSSQKRSSIFKV